ncbi:MAG: restriction endonuclease [Verrucomicrobiota bacterium]
MYPQTAESKPQPADLPQRLVDAVAHLYSSAGFQLSRPEGIAPEITFIATPTQQPAGFVAVGCYALDPSQLVKMEQLDAFWRGVSQSGAQSAVFVTNSYFDPAVLAAANSVPLQLIDGAGLSAALGQSQQAATTPDPPAPEPEPEVPNEVPESEEPIPGYPPKEEIQPTSEPVESQTEVAAASEPITKPEQPAAKKPAKAKFDPKGFVTAFTNRSRPKGKSSKASFLSFGKKKNADDSPASDTEESPTASKGKAKDGSDMDWSAAGKTRRWISPKVAIAALICLLATGVLVILDQFPAEREQLSNWMERYIIHPVMNPIEGQSTADSKPVNQAPISAIPPITITSTPVEALDPMDMEPTFDEIRRLLVHRVRTLEELKERLHAERLAAEVQLLGKVPGRDGANYVEQAGGDLEVTVKLICEDEEGGPRLSPEDQKRVLPYLAIEGGRLELTSPDIDIYDLLEPPADLFSVSPKLFPESLELLERRLFVEEALEARRYAQSVAAVTSAARSTGIDFVLENEGDLDAVIASVVEGRRIQDPTSPFDGHLFKTPEPPADKLEDVKRFLVIMNGKLRYEETLPTELETNPKFDPNLKSSVGEAIQIAELLLRHTAEQILVNKANRDKSLMPVKGLH